jgi:hypothetical protein
MKPITRTGNKLLAPELTKMEMARDVKFSPNS